MSDPKTDAAKPEESAAGVPASAGGVAAPLDAAPEKGIDTPPLHKRVKVESVEPPKIDFDFENPRLTEELGALPKNEVDMVDLLWEKTDVEELVRSIAQNGFLPFDEMVVIKTGVRFKVLEGNRRLAAIRLLTKEELCKRLKISVPNMSEEAKESLEKIDVKVVGDALDAQAYIGFKHVNGPQKWDSLSKAKFAVEWLKRGAFVSDVAKALGDTHNTVKRLVFGYRVLEQAKGNSFRVDNVFKKRFAFSHLYTALTQDGYQKYLELPTLDTLSEIPQSPVPEAKIPQLSRVMMWLYGSKSERKEPLIRRQNDDLSRLGKALALPQSRHILEGGGDLEKAYESVEPKAVRFVTALVECSQRAEEALSLSSDFDGADPSVLDLCKTLNRTVDTITQVVQSKIGE